VRSPVIGIPLDRAISTALSGPEFLGASMETCS
jgi:hypothetical protein